MTVKAYTIFVLVLMIIGANVKAQPSFSVSFDFRLFNEAGISIGLDEFCNNFKLTQQGYVRDFCNNPNYPRQKLYNSQTKKFNLSTGTVYADLELAFIRQADTMIIRVINSGYGALIDIDSLVFKPGKYAITCSSRIVNGKSLPYASVLKIKQVDFKIAGAAYYNFLLDKFNYMIKMKVSETGTHTIENSFRQLQRMYHIPADDLQHKTAVQLASSDLKQDL